MRYRTALTPEQKNLKRDYLLQEQRQHPAAIPTAEDLLAEEGDFGDFLRDEMDEAARAARSEAFAEAQHTLMFDDVPHAVWTIARKLYNNDTSYDSVEDAYEDAADDWMFQYADAAIPEAEETFRRDLQEQIDEAARRITTGDYSVVYRVVALPAQIDPTTHSSLGLYWTVDEVESRPFGFASLPTGEEGARQAVWRYVAMAEDQNVNVAETVRANIIGRLLDVPADANEIRFYKGAPLWVYQVERVELQDDRYVGTGEVHDINDVRYA